MTNVSRAEDFLQLGEGAGEPFGQRGCRRMAPAGLFLDTEQGFEAGGGPAGGVGGVAVEAALVDREGLPVSVAEPPGKLLHEREDLAKLLDLAAGIGEARCVEGLLVLHRGAA
jgi:hypothetical protein